MVNEKHRLVFWPKNSGVIVDTIDCFLGKRNRHALRQLFFILYAILKKNTMDFRNILSKVQKIRQKGTSTCLVRP